MTHDPLVIGTAADRLAALPRAAAQVPPRITRTGTNLHIHCNHSFSVFRSPTEVAHAAFTAGVEVAGLNDFFTTAGIAEFRQACRYLGLPAVGSLECIAMDRAMEQSKTLMNDPGNPGRIYLCGKGVATPDDTAAQAGLERLRDHQTRRNQALVAACDRHFQATVQQPGPTWADVVGQTPAGNTTERHVAKAILRRIEGLGLEATYAKVVGAPAPAGDAERQNHIRAQLLKAGKPCFVPEPADAFPDVATLRGIFLGLGAIPTYPILGNPLTGGEQDIPALFDRLDTLGFRAVELIPARNTPERVAAVVHEAERRRWPVTDGTEHNTPAMEPLTTAWGMDERFRPAFRRGALVVLGHQLLVERGLPGYVDRTGAPVRGGYEMCLSEGSRALPAVVDTAGRMHHPG